MVPNPLPGVDYTLCLKPPLRRHRGTQVTTHAALAGTAALILATGPTHAVTIARETAAMSPLGWTLVIVMALIVTIGANQLFSYGLQRMTAGAAAPYSSPPPPPAAPLPPVFLRAPAPGL